MKAEKRLEVIKMVNDLRWNCVFRDMYFEEALMMSDRISGSDWEDIETAIDKSDINQFEHSATLTNKFIKTYKDALKLKNKEEAKNDSRFTSKVPMYIRLATLENVRDYNLSFGDAFDCAMRDKAKKGSFLYKAFYYSDYRELVPCIYEAKYLDFTAYPLKYAGI